MRNTLETFADDVMAPTDGTASPAGSSTSSEPTPILGRVTHDNTKADQLEELAKSFPTGPQALAPDNQEDNVVGPLNAHSRINGKMKHTNGLVNGHLDGDEEDGPTETSPLITNRDDDTAPAAQTEQKFLLETNPGRFWLIFMVILINLFISAFDGTIMASSHPVITSHFHAANSASWLSTSFLLTSTTFQPLLGRLSDALGRKPLFVMCTLVFFLSVLWCALAGSIESFIAARAVCGLGAGGAGTLGSIIVSDLVPIA